MLYTPETSRGNFWSGWQQRLRALRNIPPVMRIVWDSGPRVIAGGLTVRLIAALIPVAMLSVTKVIIDGVAAGTTGKPVPAMFWWTVALEFALAACGAVLARAISLFDSLFADQFTRHVSLVVMKHASKLDLSAYENPAFYDKLERARVQATDRIAMIQAAGTMLQQIVVVITLSASILVFSPLLLLLMTLCLVPAFLGESHFAFLGYSLNFSLTPVRRQLDYLRVLGASKDSAKELKLFALNSFLVERYSELADQVYDQNVALARHRLRAGSLFGLLGTLGYYGAYAYVIYCTLHGEISIGKLVFLSGAIAAASTNIQSIFATFSSIADQALFLTDLLDFLAVRPKVCSLPGALLAPRPIRSGLEFRNVSFTYPGNSRIVLHHLDFRLEPGERIAIIGENGQGKTTLVKLITRLYDPTEGQILLDGVNFRDYSVEDLHRQIAVIFQDYMRYEMSVADNIGVGLIDQRHDLEKLRQAACKSLADAVIARLPDSYEQMLGRRFEGGVDLSGGEWQKIALARAYLRDAQLLILDEPTASLDARSEHEVFQRFTELTAGKMALLISHRFSTVRMADRIVVLKNGRIAEEGSHSKLVSLGGLYSEMFELQAASYR